MNKQYLISTSSNEDISDIIDMIIDDNKFDRGDFLKECGLMPNLKNVKLDHLVTICKHKGYSLILELPEDRITLEYYLENNEVETETPPVNELPEESDEELSFLDE